MRIKWPPHGAVRLESGLCLCLCSGWHPRQPFSAQSVLLQRLAGDAASSLACFSLSSLGRTFCLVARSAFSIVLVWPYLFEQQPAAFATLSSSELQTLVPRRTPLEQLGAADACAP